VVSSIFSSLPVIWQTFHAMAIETFVGSYLWLNVNTKQYRNTFQKPGGVVLRNL
jgi:hypothetical protein